MPPIKLIGLAGKSDTCESSAQKKWVNFKILANHLSFPYRRHLGPACRPNQWWLPSVHLALVAHNPGVEAWNQESTWNGGWMIGAKHYKTHSRYFSWKVKRSKTRQKAAWHSVSLALTSEIAGKHRVLPKLFHTDFMLVYFITFDLPCESSLIESKYGEERTCRTCPSFATFLVSIYDTAREKNTYNLQDASCANLRLASSSFELKTAHGHSSKPPGAWQKCILLPKLYPSGIW